MSTINRSFSPIVHDTESIDVMSGGNFSPVYLNKFMLDNISNVPYKYKIADDYISLDQTYNTERSDLYDDYSTDFESYYSSSDNESDNESS